MNVKNILMNIMEKKTLYSDPHNDIGKSVKWILLSSLEK